MSPILALVIANLIWGAAPPIFKYALQDIPPFTLAFIRFYFAGILFIPFAYKHWHTITGRDWKNIFWGAMWGITFNISFFFIGLQHAPSINVHVFSSLGPVLLYFVAIHILREKPHLAIIKGILISLVGTAVIVFGPLFMKGSSTGGESFAPSSQVIGNLLFFMSMIGAVLHTVYNKKAVERVNPLVVTLFSFLISSVTFIPLMSWELQTWSFSQMNAHSWLGVIYGIFFSSALGYFLHNYALAKLPAQKIGVYTYIEPPVAVLIAIPLLGEYPDMFFIIGSVLVFFGIYISQKHPHFRKVQ